MSLRSDWHRFQNRPAIRKVRGAFGLVDDLGGKAIRPLVRNITHPALIATIVLVISLGTLINVATHHKPASAVAPQVAGLDGDLTASGSALPKIQALKTRYSADIVLTSTQPLSDAQIARARAAAGNGAAILVSTGQLSIGKGVTGAIGVDPGSFRAFTPKSTAESTPLWQYIQLGNIAVAHTLARAQGIKLPSTVIAGNGSRHEILQVAAYATTGLPGVGVVLNKEKSRALGLKERTGLILQVRGQDPLIATTKVREALPSMNVLPVHVGIVNGKIAWYPPALGRISSPFGPRDGRFHEGIDIAANYGAPIYAAADGYVLYAGPAIGFGNEVVIQHSNGVVTVYGHMERLLVRYGRVTAGQAIALVGAEGDANGPHLHFEVHLNDKPVDPLQWLRDRGVRIGG